MGEASRILRSSVYTFFHVYHHFVSVATLLVLPVSASLLLSQALIASSPFALRFISSRLRSLFDAASFPASSTLFSLLNLMLSQTIFSVAFTLPFTLTFLILAKASVIQVTGKFPYQKHSRPPPPSSLLSLYCPLLLTHLFNSFLILSANAAVFGLLFLVFNAAELAGLSSTLSLLVMSLAGAILYSVVLANTVVTCNLAIVVSAMDKCGGYLPLLKACVLVRARVATALSVTLPTGLALAAVEALFQYRVTRVYYRTTKFNSSIVWEAFTIAYMHSMLTVLEIIASCLFYKSCKATEPAEIWEDAYGYHRVELEPGDKGHEI